MKKALIIITTMFVLTATTFGIYLFNNSKKTDDMSSVHKTILAVDKALSELGYEFSYIEKQFSPITYVYEDGSDIVYQQFYCSDPERIKNGDISFFEDIFDPKNGEDTQGVFVNGEKALFYEKDNRAYLFWFPNDKAILMINYDPDKVEQSEIIKMAESCQ